MSGFMNTSLAPSPAPADPRKHVNYVLGMVLGVDDFNQEHAYLSGRDRLAARELAELRCAAWDAREHRSRRDARSRGAGLRGRRDQSRRTAGARAARAVPPT